MKAIPLELSNRIKDLMRCWTVGASHSGVQGWMYRRSPRVEHDRVLTSATHVWLRQIPSGIHPKQLCHRHPHIANRLAQCWGDPTRIEELVDELLIDRRGQRQGLSPRVVAEVERLELFHARVLRTSFDPQQLLRVRRAFIGPRIQGR